MLSNREIKRRIIKMHNDGWTDVDIAIKMNLDKADVTKIIVGYERNKGND